MSGIRSIKSKESRQKLRRWGFAASINRAGNVVGQNMPGVVYGDFAEAKVAGRLKDMFLEKNPDVEVTIDPIPYETISIQTKRQFEGLNAQSSLVAKAAFILAEKYRLSVGVIDKDVAQIVDEAVAEAREFLFPRLAQANAKMAAFEGAAESAVESIPTEPEKKDPKRGIEAVQEALEAPVAEAA